MLKKFFFQFAFSLLLVTSCQENTKVDSSIAHDLNKNLVLSNDLIHRNTDLKIQIFRGYSSNPALSSKTNPLLTKMDSVSKISTRAFEYIESLKRGLKIEADIRIENMKEIYNEDDLSAVDRFFIKKNKGLELKNELLKYQTSIEQLSPDLFKSSNSPAHFFDYLSEQNNSLNKEFVNIYFKNSTPISTIMLLSKFENDIRLCENRVVTYFNDNVAIDLPSITSYK